MEHMSDDHHELTGIDDLKPAPYNPRKIDSGAADGLGFSIERFGDLSGIVWNKRTGHIVAGHQRLTQLKARGAQLLNGDVCISVQGATKRFPVRVVDWSEVEEKAANLEANNPHISGSFDDGVVDLLREVEAGLGSEFVSDALLDALLADLPKVSVEVEEDDTPDVPSNPVTKLGDVWTLGGHALVCGDSAEHVQMASGVDCVFTDPPYGVNYQSRVDKKRRKDWGAIEGDDLKGGDLVEMIRATVPRAEYMYVCCPWDTYPEFVNALGKPRSVCVWDKGHFGLGKGYRRQFELVMFYGKLNRTDLSDVWTLSRASDYKHPTQKPVSLVAKALVDCAAKTVYDPFAGSGTTLIAAEQLSLRCTTIELEPKYCDVTIERWENLTGGKAQRNA